MPSSFSPFRILFTPGWNTSLSQTSLGPSWTSLQVPMKDDNWDYGVASRTLCLVITRSRSDNLFVSHTISLGRANCLVAWRLLHGTSSRAQWPFLLPNQVTKSRVKHVSCQGVFLITRRAAAGFRFDEDKLMSEVVVGLSWSSLTEC
jgi:hypothetical protein